MIIPDLIPELVSYVKSGSNISSTTTTATEFNVSSFKSNDVDKMQEDD